MSSLVFLLVPLTLAALVGWLRSLYLARPVDGVHGPRLTRSTGPTPLALRPRPPAVPAGTRPRRAA